MDPSVSISIVSGWVELRYYLYRSSNNQLVRTKIQNLYDLGVYPSVVDAALIRQYCTIQLTPTVGDGFYLRVEVVEGNCVGSWCWLTQAPNAWQLNRGTFTTNVSSVAINEAIPRFTLSSQYGTDAGGTPLTCESNITINGSSTSCETKYLIEVIETDASWNFAISGTNYAGAWFNGQVPTIWHLQHIAQNYGNPQNGDVVNGPPPTQYQGWTMTDRTLSNGNNNRYLVKLSVMDDIWTSKQMLIEVNANCKNGGSNYNMEEFAATLDPMSPAEVEEVQAELRNGGVEFKSLKQIAMDSRLDKVEELSFKVFPNPASSTINLQFSEDVSLETVNLVNASGQRFEVKAEKVQNDIYAIDVKALKKGFYVIYVQVDNAIKTEKIQIIED
ncbi:T9SS type A sorting domain-containing protein [Croceimicrobium hydrocarbonivorans]|uniref:T9SS type A sorting domain-containing protein n=1 Tax=Croceimicrobium hydrocarbonivorans TaxID=2761580 RepID=A0A7H0VD62_9FLAO|nr:T9SS type A sorting domain-containing protein [Croceimicrobium hydrocarbonivorans]QNR23660.1 T9SS type A sorting domain-containing protein [Croceimicrobium hydrocarbonivorans]